MIKKGIYTPVAYKVQYSECDIKIIMKDVLRENDTTNSNNSRITKMIGDGN